ncbi:MAG: ROK family protein, partial [bacterium]
MHTHFAQPELDLGFEAPSLAMRRYREAVARLPKHNVLFFVLTRPDGSASRWTLDIAPPGGPLDRETLRLAERVAKLLIWAHGGNRLWVAGSPEVARHLQNVYRPGGARAFDVQLMAQAYLLPFEVLAVTDAELPPVHDVVTPAGGHWDGCRLGFDLGASDFKLAAVRDGEPVFTAEIPWDPKNASDPAYHFSKIMAGLREAAAHLPRVDAIGGSSAGVIVDNEPRLGSLFRSVSAE